MQNSLPIFESAYAGEPLLEGVEEVPWNIGEPQPPIAALIEAGEVRGKVLDAGCGVAETSLRLAAEGYDVVGVDASPSAIEQARQSAQRRDLTVEFVVADITELSGYDGQFSTVIDSTLFHSMPPEARDPYLAAIARAAAPGAVLHVLVFSTDARFPEGMGPNSVTEQELRDTVGAHWTVDRVTPSRIHANIPREAAESTGVTPDGDRDERGRLRIPAFLLRAHLPG